MMEFTKFDHAMMHTAYVWAELSYCKRRQVGACIVRDNGIISHGYNGTAPGQDNVCEQKYITCPCGEDIDVTDIELNLTSLYPQEPSGRAICTCGITNRFTDSVVKLKTHEYVLHAEQNAITRAARLGIPLDGSVIYTTSLPCNECAKLIVGCGIKKVYYVESYKANKTAKYLQSNGVELLQMPNSKL